MNRFIVFLVLAGVFVDFRVFASDASENRVWNEKSVQVEGSRYHPTPLKIVVPSAYLLGCQVSVEHDSEQKVNRIAVQAEYRGVRFLWPHFQNFEIDELPEVFRVDQSRLVLDTVLIQQLLQGGYLRLQAGSDRETVLERVLLPSATNVIAIKRYRSAQGEMDGVFMPSRSYTQFELVLDSSLSRLMAIRVDHTDPGLVSWRFQCDF